MFFLLCALEHYAHTLIVIISLQCINSNFFYWHFNSAELLYIYKAYILRCMLTEVSFTDCYSNSGFKARHS